MPVGFRMTTWGKGSGPIPPPQPKPYDSEVEFLESDGNQWIDTGISTNTVGANGRFVATVKINNLRTRFMGYVTSIFGAPGDICLAVPDSSRTDIPYNYSGGWVDSYISDFDNLQATPYSIDFRFSSGSQSLYINGVLGKTSQNEWTPSTTDKHIMLFRAQSSYLGSSRFYACKIYAGDTLLADYIPVRKNGVGYLYDKVSDELFGNQGTGDFQYGEDVVPVEYLESTGTQYIDVNINYGWKTGAVVDYTLLDASVVSTIFGASSARLDAGTAEELKLQVNAGGSEKQQMDRYGSSSKKFAPNVGTRQTFTFDPSKNSGSGRYVSSLVGEILQDDAWRATQYSFVNAKFGIFHAYMNRSEGLISPCPMRLYSLKIYDHSSAEKLLEHDYAPVRVGSEGAMMDTLTRIVYRNQGTGAFLYGADKDPDARPPYKCELEFLESTGTQYINTGVKFTTDNARVKFTASVTYASDKMLCGSQNHSAENNFGLVCYLYNNAMRVYMGTSNTGGISALVDGNVHIVDLQANNGTLTKTIDGTTSTANYSGSIVSGEDFTIFTSWKVATSSMADRCVSGKIYAFQIWNNGVLVRDLIPVLDWDDNAKMFDKVTQTYPTHYGTFVAGPEIHPVEYISSDGNAYINTGVVPTTTMETSIRAMITAAPTGLSVLGGTDISGKVNATYAVLRFDNNSYVCMVNYNNGISLTPPVGSWFDLVMNQSNTRNLLLNGVNLGTFTGSVIFPSGNSLPMYVFCRNSASGTYPFKEVRLANLSIADNGSTVRDYKAIRIGSGSTWAGAMIDKTTHIVYRNQGTGAFLYGADKDPDARPLYRYMKVVVPETKGSADNQYEGTEQNFQVSKLDLLDASGNYFEYPAGTTATNSPVVRVNTDQGPLKLLNHAASQPNDKVCIAVRTKTGADNFPVTMTYDFGSACLNTAIYSRWTAYTSGDTGNIPSRNPSLKLYFSADGTNWDLADEVSYTAFPNASSTQAFTRRLFPDYSIDGLICRYGGKDNGGAGIHNSSTTVWKNLGSLGQAFDATKSNATWTDDGATFARASSPYAFSTPNGLMSGYMKGEWTIEVVFSPDAGFFSNYSGVCANHSFSSASRVGIVGIQYQFGKAYFSTYKGSSGDGCHIGIPQNLFTQNFPVSVVMTASASNAAVAWYMNGKPLTAEQVGSSSILLPSSGADLNVSGYTGPFFIGNAIDAVSRDRGFSGKIHELRIYNKMITADTVANNFKYDKAEYGIVDAS